MDQLTVLKSEHLKTWTTLTISSKVNEHTKCLIWELKIKRTIQLKDNSISVIAVRIESSTNLYITISTLRPNEPAVSLPVTEPSCHNTLNHSVHLCICNERKYITLWILTLGNHLVHCLLEHTHIKLVKYKLSCKTLYLRNYQFLLSQMSLPFVSYTSFSYMFRLYLHPVWDGTCSWIYNYSPTFKILYSNSGNI